jgi:hypothetical protein
LIASVVLLKSQTAASDPLRPLGENAEWFGVNADQLVCR